MIAYIYAPAHRSLINIKQTTETLPHTVYKPADCLNYTSGFKQNDIEISKLRN